MPLLLGLAAALCAGSSAMAQGDGSAVNNPDLLRGSFSPFCEPAMLCHQGRVAPAPPAIAQAPLQPVNLTAAPASTSAVPPPQPIDRLPVAASPALIDPAPHQADHHTPWRAAFELALRGSVTFAEGGQRYEALATPSARWRFEGSGTQMEFGGAATLTQPADSAARVASGRADALVRQAIGPNTGLALDAAIALSQDDPRGLSVTLPDVVVAPLEIDLSTAAAITHRFGRADASLSLGASRSVVGPTGFAGGVQLDNAQDSVSGYRGGLRLGYTVTPILGVFVAGDAGREIFDAPSADLGASRNGWTYALRGGVSGNWNDVTRLEASLGSGWRTFDDVGLPEARSLIYGLALDFNPTAVTRLRAGLDTAIAPGTGGSAASVDYTLTLELAHRINQWLGVRANGEAIWSQAQQGGALIRRYGAGLGADYALGAHTDVSLEYGYGWRDDPAATPVTRQEHRLSAGLTLRY